MAETEIDLLTDEIRRIVTAPYAVWLKKLQDTIHKVDKAVLQQWADGHPCQINALATAVIDGLQLWPHVIDIIGHFCHVLAFRNAVLTIRPSLLDTLLTRAIESQHRYDEYSVACISMLSAPLPEDTPLPASAAVFFLKVMDEAVQTATASTIRPVYSMLVGVGPLLLDVIPEAEATQFQERLIRLLRNVDDQAANLLCLAIFARLVVRSTGPTSSAEVSSEGQTPVGATIPTAQISRYHTIQQFFNQKRAVKTLDLVVLRVIFACSNSSNLSLKDSVESLELAKEIISAVDVEEKVDWLKSNGPKLRKLYEKVLRVDLAGELQSMALEVIFSLVKVESLPAQLSKTVLSLIRASEPSVSTVMAERRLSQWAIEYFAPRMDETFVSEVMGSALKTAVQQVTPSYKALRMCQTSGLIVCAFAAAVHQTPHLRSAILFTLSANAFSRSLNDFLALPLPMAHDAEACTGSSVCHAALARSQRKLQLDICSLFLRTGLLASTDQAGIDPALAVSLLEKQVEFATAIPACRVASQSFHCNGALPLVEQSSPAPETGASSDWRARLSADLLRNATNHSESIIHTVGEVCRDLEDRCEVVEQPLREEQERSKNFETQLEAARTRTAALESQAEERNLFLNGLDAEKNSLEHQLEASEARVTQLTDLHHEMDSKFAAARAEAARSAAAAKDEASDQDLKHIAIVSTMEDTINDQSERIEQIELSSKALRDELTAVSHAELANQKRVGELEAEVAEGARARQVEKVSSVQKDVDIESLRSLRVRLQAEVEAAQKVIRDQATSIESLQKELQSARVSSEEDFESLKQTHASDRQAAATEVARMVHDHQEETARLRADLQKAVDTASAESGKRDSTISGLERKIEKLLKERKEKAKEFAEAQDLSTKLMAVMGLKPDQASAHSYNPATSSLKDIFVDSPKSQHGSRRQTTTATSQSFESSTSSKSGPTPKRTRPRRSTRTLSMQQAKIDLGTKTVKTAHDTTSRSSREPLKDLSVSVHNKSPVRTQRHGFGKPQPEPHHHWTDGKDQGDEAMEDDDPSFGGSDIFTSTEKEQALAWDDQGHSQVYEESTADF